MKKLLEMILEQVATDNPESLVTLLLSYAEAYESAEGEIEILKNQLVLDRPLYDKAVLHPKGDLDNKVHEWKTKTPEANN